MEAKNPYSYKELTSLEEDTGFLVLQLSNLWQQNHKRVLEKYYEITHTQFAVMASIHWLSIHRPDRVTQVGLAKHIKTDPMTISQTIKGLEKLGYVSRDVCPRDVRAKILMLTPKGQELTEQAIDTIARAEAHFFETLGKENRKRFNEYMAEVIRINE